MVESVNGIGAGLSRTQMEAELQVAVLKKQQEVVRDLGEQAVDMIRQSGMQSAGVGNRLDVSV